MAKKQTLSISHFVADRAESLKNIRASVKRVTDNKDQFAMAYAAVNAVAKVAQLDGEVYINAEPSVWANWRDDKEFALVASITLMNVNSLKDGRVPQVLQAAEKAGFDFDATQDYVSETYAQREFKGTGLFNGVSVRMRITAELENETPNCRRVQTGTEIKEVAKYEIVCN
jgi:hypothetical protein